jgi:integrase
MPNASPATQNRQIYTPVLAVLNKAARAGKCRVPVLDRPEGHDKLKPLTIPDQAWFDAVLPQCSPKLRACLMAITCHGLRIADAIERTPDDIEPEGWILHIPDTKNGEPAAIPLAEPVVEALTAYNWREGPWLFGTHNRSNIIRAIKAACKRAGVRYFGTHAIGRHSFATRVLKAGKSVKFLKEAGRWKSPAVPMRRYGHLERSEVNDEVKEIAADWSDKAKSRRVVTIKKA